MAATPAEFEQRLQRLEKELQDLRALLTARPAVPWWEQIVGEFKDDKMFKEIARHGRRIRRAGRNGAR